MFFARLFSRPRAQTLILHIGMGKTGTTAIQESLWRNRHYLLANGYRYPSAACISCAHHLISPHRPTLLVDNGWEFLDPPRWLPKVLREADRKVLMSTELIFWAEPEAIASFCEEVSQAFRLRVCAYLRRQDLAIMAGYNQRVKVGQQVRPLSDELPDLVERYNYQQLLRPWSEALGKENVSVFPYEYGQMIDGDAVADFYKKVLHIDPPDTAGAVRDANPGLCADVLEYKRCLNAVSSGNAQVAPFDRALRKFSALSRDAPHSILSHQDRRYILAKFEESNRAVANTYLGPGTRLFLESLTEQDAVPQVATTHKLSFFEFLCREHPDLLACANSLAETAVSSPDPLVRSAAHYLLRMPFKS